MRVSIVADDNLVLIEGIPYTVDCSALVAQGIHAIQWYSTFGEVEFATDLETGHRKPNERITDASPFRALIDAWMVEARKPVPAPAQTTPVP
jgi:hypothetical protein